MVTSDRIPAGPSARPPRLAHWVGRLRRLAYATNPFYPASALLLLVGIRLCVEPTTSIENARRLVAVLVGSIVLMAGTAAVIIRLGRLWDEARLLLLTIVILTLATSMVFDEMVLVHPHEGNQFLAVSLALAIVVSETLRWVCRIRLGVLFVIPFYLLLACFFAYPAMLTQFFRHSWHSALGWGIAGFAPACGLAFLSLLPAVRRGAVYVRTPADLWRWPSYPWSLFATLGAAVCIRSSLIHESFNPVRDDHLVAHVYLAVPFLFCAAVVFLEIALVARSLLGVRIALALPFVFLALACAEETTARKGIPIVQMVTVTAGSPLYLASRALVLFQVYALLRRRGASDWALGAALALASLVGTSTPDFTRLGGLVAVPLLGFAALQWFRRHDGWPSLRLFLATASLIAVVWTEFRHTPLAFHWVRGLQVVIGSGVVLGSAFRDGFSRIVQRCSVAAWCLLAIAMVIIPGCQLADSLAWGDKLCLMLAAAGTVAYALATGAQTDRCVATATLVALALDLARESYAAMELSFLQRGRLALLGAVCSFLAAVALSAWKARCPARSGLSVRKPIAAENP